MACFINLAAQCLALFRGKPALACAFSLSARCALAVLALLLAAGIGLRLLLLGGRTAWVVAWVTLLRQPVCGAGYHQQGQTES